MMALRVSTCGLVKVAHFVGKQVCKGVTINANTNRFKAICSTNLFFHTTRRNNDLKDFFDPEANWQDGPVICGRPWRKDELRIKSNEDLHKLWYVLLKERNRIMTLEADLERQGLYLTDSWRMEKVEVSMENLLYVVKERDIAFNMLEAGESGAPKTYQIRNALGIKYKRTETEHLIPRFMNRKFRLMHSKYEPWMAKWILKCDEVARRKQEKKEKYYKYQVKLLQERHGLSESEAGKSVDYVRRKSRKMRDYSIA
ncbi:39S ribosomal protein L47, mitochondrial-like [Ostrea edulis]|uniref:39S ribosomal protein L47, mitochondrial-like n=1 Tax=Ostrea edulis TaxID=37623 RepID=UPI0024AF7C0E|nr:39S ribosomal protein L47, mitochondrial-like [Ostrea edulis]